MKLLSSVCLVLVCLLSSSCSQTTNPASLPTASESVIPSVTPTVSQPPQKTYTYKTIKSGEELGDAVALYNRAAANMVIVKSGDCKKIDHPSKLSPYSIVMIVILDKKVYCVGTNTRTGFNFNSKNFWSLQGELNSESSLAKLALAIDSTKMAVIFESQESGRVDLQVMDKPINKDYPEIPKS
jgi:hypothetical protein